MSFATSTDVDSWIIVTALDTTMTSVIVNGKRETRHIYVLLMKTERRSV